MSSLTIYAAKILLKRAISGDLEEDTPDLTTPDDAEDSNPVENEILKLGVVHFIVLLMSALWSSYFYSNEESRPSMKQY